MPDDPDIHNENADLGGAPPHSPNNPPDSGGVPSDDPLDDDDVGDDDDLDASDTSASSDSSTTPPGETTYPGETTEGANNHAPLANAGSAQMAYEGKVSLSGGKSFDVDGDPLSYHWSLRNGPGPAVVVDPNNDFTAVTLSEPGHYLFRLTVDDGIATDTADVLVVWPPLVAEGDEHKPEFVLHVSIDGLRADIVGILGPDRLPTMHRLRREGAWTENARSDNVHTVTVPNHTCQLTGRAVAGANGHGYDLNYTLSDQSLHEYKGNYVASVFDVIHDHGLRTGYFASKNKIDVLHLSYNAQNGAEDRTGPDNGRAKIDHVFVHYNDPDVLSNFETTMDAAPFEYSFLHIAEPDDTGHFAGWSTELDSEYADAVVRADTLLGRAIAVVENSFVMSGRTLVIVTADHGGTGINHTDATQFENFAVPFYTWGPSVAPQVGLYTLNMGRRANPGLENLGPGAGLQPIRNGEAANLACQALGLPNVPGSIHNVELPLQLH